MGDRGAARGDPASERNFGSVFAFTRGVPSGHPTDTLGSLFGPFWAASPPPLCLFVFCLGLGVGVRGGADFQRIA